ncbi:MAG: U32 family peptidase [Desulfobacterales bacterium]|nr:U32 family peptidase [Desulfobacterales bacterium]
MDKKIEKPMRPAILAPAGSRPSFLAALAAGADAIYCGLKQFSARMEAHNFTFEELTALTELAHAQEARVYVTVNTLIKPGELGEVGQMVDRLNRGVKPDAIILQDLGLVSLVRKAGYTGQLNLSTLANVSSPSAIRWVGDHVEVDRVVIPRELNIDEIKAMAAACPPHLDLEVFVHGALCYGVSGRCYWSSFLGGKSGLRGRCVQPCRRQYTQNDTSRRFFSCQDLSLDVLVKVLMTIPKVKSWKIEGRKKGPHYVFYTVQAYQMLRDHGTDPQAKRAALELLEMALGRRGTHYHFLPQRPQSPLSTDGNTASGLYIGSVQGGREPYLSPRLELLGGDVLRIGYEDEPWHAVQKIGRAVPKKGRLHLKLPPKKIPRKGTPVFLIDRREETLNSLLDKLEARFKERLPDVTVLPSHFHLHLPEGARKAEGESILHICRYPSRKATEGLSALWLSTETTRALSPEDAAGYWWALPPVIWPAEENDMAEQVAAVIQNGGRNFILNAPWQKAFFEDRKDFNLWAGPFCNLSNPMAISALAAFGFKGAIVSPELGREDYLALPQNSPLPLGIILSGSWPLCVSRIISEDMNTGASFSSPKGEEAWARKYGGSYWIFPNWKLDIRSQKKELQKAGYRLFVDIAEPIPEGIMLKKRPGLWNWDLALY